MLEKRCFGIIRPVFSAGEIAKMAEDISRLEDFWLDPFVTLPCLNSSWSKRKAQWGPQVSLIFPVSIFFFFGFFFRPRAI